MDEAKAFTKDHYYTLGLTPQASNEDIQNAYREMSDRFGPHVQMSGQDPEAMIKAYRDITEAFQILSDPERRAYYDRANLPHLQKTRVRGIWEKLTGTGEHDLTPNKAETTTVDVEVTLREAMKGAVRRVKIDENLPCQSCYGLKPVQRMGCAPCRGAGTTHKTRYEDIQLEPGLYPGMQLRKPDLGKFDIRVNKTGDLLIRIRVTEHTFFTIEGRDLTCTVPVTFLEAILGSEIEVPTATGKVMMKIQPLTQTGRVYRLKGMGLAGADLLATIEVVVPRQISPEEVELFRKLKAASTAGNPREELIKKIRQNEMEQTQQLPAAGQLQK